MEWDEAEALLALRAAQGREYDPNDAPAIRADFVRALLLGLPFEATWHEETAEKYQDYSLFAPTEPGSAGPVPITAAGVRIKGVSIKGTLDLADCLGAGGQGLPALSIEDSEFVPIGDEPRECLKIAHARLARLSLRGSRLHKVNARECFIDGPLDLSRCAPLSDHVSVRPAIDRALWRSWLAQRRSYLLQCVWASLKKVPVPGIEPAGPKRAPQQETPESRDRQCWFDFKGARIDGEVRADGLCARAPEGAYGLDLSDAEVLGSIEIRVSRQKTAELVGGFLLDAAQVHGALWVTGALLVGSGGNCALRAQGATIDGLVVLNGGFTSYGCVRLQQARLGGSLQIEDATLDGAGGEDALIADGVSVGADVLIRGDVVTLGTLRLRNARIAGDLAMNGAALDGAGNAALEASFVEVRGAAQLCEGFTAQGQVVFAGARVAGMFDFSSAGLLSSDARPALNAENVVVGGDMLLREHFVAVGGVRTTRFMAPLISRTPAPRCCATAPMAILITTQSATSQALNLTALSISVCTIPGKTR